jgi:hypothetical protein
VRHKHALDVRFFVSHLFCFHEWLGHVLYFRDRDEVAVKPEGVPVMQEEDITHNPYGQSDDTTGWQQPFPRS